MCQYISVCKYVYILLGPRLENPVCYCLPMAATSQASAIAFRHYIQSKYNRVFSMHNLNTMIKQWHVSPVKTKIQCNECCCLWKIPCSQSSTQAIIKKHYFSLDLMPPEKHTQQTTVLYQTRSILSADYIRIHKLVQHT